MVCWLLVAARWVVGCGASLWSVCLCVPGLRLRLLLPGGCAHTSPDVQYNVLQRSCSSQQCTRTIAPREVLNLGHTTGEVRYEGSFGHADYCNFVNF
jgi:hypothetical protein